MKVYVNRLCYDYSANTQFSFFTTALTYKLILRRTFSTTVSFEDAWSIATGNLLLLSERQLVNYDVVDSGWNGELMHNAFTFAKKSARCTETVYTYIAAKGTGKASSCTVDRPGKCHGIQGHVN